MSNQYIPFHVSEDTYVPGDVTSQAISKVHAFLNRKKAFLAELSQKDRKKYLSKQAKLFSSLREEHRPSLEDGQHFVSYRESLPFGNGHACLQDMFRRLANENDIREEETGTLQDAAIVGSIVERVRNVIHNDSVRARANVSQEVAPMTASGNRHVWRPESLYFTKLSQLQEAQVLFAKPNLEDIDRWTSVVVQDVNLGESEEDLNAALAEKIAKAEAKAAEKQEKEALRKTQQEAKDSEKASKTAEKAKLAQLKADAKKAVEMMTASEAIKRASETQALVDAQRALTLPPVTDEMKAAIARARHEQGKLESETSQRTLTESNGSVAA